MQLGHSICMSSIITYLTQQAISSTHDNFGRRLLLDLNMCDWPYNITYDLNQLDRIYVAMNVTIYNDNNWNFNVPKVGLLWIGLVGCLFMT